MWALVEQMQSKHKHYSLQLICFYEEGNQWLEYRGRRNYGTVHTPNLALDEEGEDEKEETETEAIEMEVKSRETLIHEKF